MYHRSIVGQLYDVQYLALALNFWKLLIMLIFSFQIFLLILYFTVAGFKTLKLVCYVITFWLMFVGLKETTFDLHT